MKKTYTLKTYTPDLFIWTAPENIITDRRQNKTKKPYFCNATAGSQGQDWITTYVFDIKLLNNIQQHIAYVECDYVQ